jgi:hypothetical protein
MLLAHELEHVVQQQRGGGDPDLGERMPLSSLTRHTAHSEGHGRTAAQAALGASAPVASAVGVGVACQSTDEERIFWDRAMEGARANVKGGIGVIEGMAMEGRSRLRMRSDPGGTVMGFPPRAGRTGYTRL